MMDIDVTVEQANGIDVAVFRMKGDLDTESHRQLETRSREAYESGVRNILLDLAEVNYISSAGLQAIHYIFTMLEGPSSAKREQRTSGGRREAPVKSVHLKLASPRKRVLHILNIAGYDMFVEIFDDRKKALKSFSTA